MSRQFIDGMIVLIATDDIVVAFLAFIIFSVWAAVRVWKRSVQEPPKVEGK